MAKRKKRKHKKKQQAKTPSAAAPDAQSASPAAAEEASAGAADPAPAAGGDDAAGEGSDAPDAAEAAAPAPAEPASKDPADEDSGEPAPASGPESAAVGGAVDEADEAAAAKDKAAKADAAEGAEESRSPWSIGRSLFDEFQHVAPAAILVAVFCFFVYLNSFWIPFLFDDAPVVTRNPLMWSWSGIIEDGKPKLHQPFTRTLTYWTFVANFQLAHPNGVPSEPYVFRDFWSYHLVSVLLHLANVVFLFLILRALFRARPNEVPPEYAHWVALIGAAFWGAHPGNTMAVSYIAQRFTLLGSFFFLGSLLTYVRLRQRLDKSPEPGEEPESIFDPGNLARLALCFFLAFLCCLSKENTTVIPLALLLVEVFFYRGRRWYLPGMLIGMFGFCLLIGLMKLPLSTFFPATSPTATSRLDYFLTEIPVLLRYLRLHALPTDLTVEQSWPILFHWNSGWVKTFSGEPYEHARTLVIAAGVGHCLIWGLAARLIKQGHRFIPFAIAFFYLGNLVESSFIPILDPMVDHRMYLPCAMLGTAVAVALVRSIPWLQERWPHARVAVFGLLVAWVLALAGGTVVRNFTWQSGVGLWTDTIEKRPDCARAYSSLGMEHLYKGQWVEAIPPIETALQLGPYHVEGWNNVGKAYLELDLLEKAKTVLEKGIEINRVVPSPSVIYCYNNLGLVHLKLAERIKDRTSPVGRQNLRVHWLRASALLAKAIQINPNYDIAYVNQGQAEYNLMLHETDPTRRQQHAVKAANALAGGQAVYQRKGRNISVVMMRWHVIALHEAGKLKDSVVMGLNLINALGDPKFAANRSLLIADVARFTEAALAAQNPVARELLPHVLPLAIKELGTDVAGKPELAFSVGLLAAHANERKAALELLTAALATGYKDPRAARAGATLNGLKRP